MSMNRERSATGADCINYTSKLQLFTELSKHSQPAATWRYGDILCKQSPTSNKMQPRYTDVENFINTGKLSIF